MYSFKFYFDGDVSHPLEIFLNFDMITNDIFHKEDVFTYLEDMRTNKKYLICGQKVSYVEVDTKAQ